MKIEAVRILLVAHYFTPEQKRTGEVSLKTIARCSLNLDLTLRSRRNRIIHESKDSAAGAGLNADSVLEKAAAAK